MERYKWEWRQSKVLKFNSRQPNFFCLRVYLNRVTPTPKLCQMYLELQSH